MLMSALDENVKVDLNYSLDHFGLIRLLIYFSTLFRSYFRPKTNVPRRIGSNIDIRFVHDMFDSIFYSVLLNSV